MQVPASFDYVVASSVDDAIAKLAADEDARGIAGGHSLLPMMKLRLASPGTLIDLSALAAELRYVRADGDAIRIGALATPVSSNPVLERACISDAARVAAYRRTRRRCEGGPRHRRNRRPGRRRHPDAVRVLGRELDPAAARDLGPHEVVRSVPVQ